MRGLRFRPDRNGLKATLFDLEADIMELVWARRLPEFSVAEIHEALERQREIAYTTVMTTVGRLHEKGVLTRIKDGRRYLYRPVMDRAAFQCAAARDMLGAMEDPAGDTAMALLSEAVGSADQEELDRLEALIRARRAALRS